MGSIKQKHMADIIKVKNSDGVVQYPVTIPEAVINEKGENILQIIRNSADVPQDLKDIINSLYLSEMNEDFNNDFAI
jgi:hypothetical protein